eukprot:COSAG02_NODE_5319_length_4442_cov_2.816947_5_plen_94_part_00
MTLLCLTEQAWQTRSPGLLLSTRETVNIAHGNHFESKVTTPNHVTESVPLFRAHTVTTRNNIAGDRKWIVGSASSANVCGTRTATAAHGNAEP